MDMTPGLLYPVFTEEVLPGDSLKIYPQVSITTAPPLAPLMSSHSVELSFFFVPTRLYVQEMDINRLQFSPAQTIYPTALPLSFGRLLEWGDDAPSGTFRYAPQRILAESFGFGSSDSNIVSSEVKYGSLANNYLQYYALSDAAGEDVFTATRRLSNGVEAALNPYSAKHLLAYCDMQGSRENFPWYVRPTRAMVFSSGNPAIDWSGTDTLSVALSNLRTKSPALLRNAIIPIGYYDIFRNYYANTQEQNFFINAYSLCTRYNNVYLSGRDLGNFLSTELVPAETWMTSNYLTITDEKIERTPKDVLPFCTWARVPLKSLDDFIMKFVQGEKSFEAAWYSTVGLNEQRGTLFNALDVFDAVPFSPTGIIPFIPEAAMYEVNAPMTLGRLANHGLVARTYSPDFNSVWLSQGVYQEMLESSKINVQNSQITVQQIRTASHLLEYDERGLVAGGRYDDWVYGQFGRKVRNRLCIPDYLGRYKSLITFDDLYSTAGTDNQPLGSLSGKGTGFIEADRPISLVSPEHGYIIGLASIAPEVSYGDGYNDLYDKTTFADIYAPVLDRIGFQPRMFTNVAAAQYPRAETNPNGSLPDALSVDMIQNAWDVKTDVKSKDLSLGYLPAWTEYTTALDRVHGAFVRGNELDYWVLSRDYGVSEPEIDYFFSVSPNFATSYILPFHFRYPFADTLADKVGNFYAQFVFDVVASRRIGKTVMPTLA